MALGREDHIPTNSARSPGKLRAELLYVRSKGTGLCSCTQARGSTDVTSLARTRHGSVEASHGMAL